MKPVTKSAIGYARFSPRPDADESQSNAKQAERITEYCETKHYELLEIYLEPDTSGAFDDNDTDPMAFYESRPVLREALDRLKRGMVFVVRWRHRVARSVHAQGLVEMEITRKRCEWEATDEPNIQTPEGKLMRQMFAGFAELQRQQIILATKRAMERYQKEGRRMGHRDFLPYGFKIDPADPARMIPCAEEQAVIGMIRVLRSQGDGARLICAALDAAGIRRRNGGTWSSAVSIMQGILARLPPPVAPPPPAPSVATDNQGLPAAVSEVDAIC